MCMIIYNKIYNNRTRYYYQSSISSSNSSNTKEVKTKDIRQFFTPVHLDCNKNKNKKSTVIVWLTENIRIIKKKLPSFFLLPRKFIPANFSESLYPRKFIPAKYLKIGHPRKFIPAKYNNFAVGLIRESIICTKMFLYLPEFFL